MAVTQRMEPRCCPCWADCLPGDYHLAEIYPMNRVKFGASPDTCCADALPWHQGRVEDMMTEQHMPMKASGVGCQLSCWLRCALPSAQSALFNAGSGCWR